jgi:hypothetical protein
VALLFFFLFSDNLLRHVEGQRLEGVLAVLGEIRGGGPVSDVESGGTICVLVADRQRPQSKAGLKPETMTATFEEFSPAHDFFDYTAAMRRLASSKSSRHSCNLSGEVMDGSIRGSIT